MERNTEPASAPLTARELNCMSPGGWLENKIQEWEVTDGHYLTKGEVAALLEAYAAHQSAADAKKIAALELENAELKARITVLTEALENFIDEEPCVYDHHGNCQTHSCSNPCSMVIARQALAGTKGEG